MRLLVFSDVHGDEEVIERIIKKAKKHDPDFLICAGDLTMLGRNLENLLYKLNKLNKPLMIIPGNHEEDNELKKVCKKYKFIIYLHKACYEINDFLFFGYGGGGFSREDNQLDRIVSQFKKRIKNKKIIVITHAPPYKTELDRVPSLGHVGNKSITNFIKEIKPKLLISGHIHECIGKSDRIRDTIIVNPKRFGEIIEI